MLNCSEKWRLPINAQKTNWMRFGDFKEPTAYQLGRIEIFETNEHKDLGVLFDKQLFFEKHKMPNCKSLSHN